jgi:hypothetical protein
VATTGEGGSFALHAVTGGVSATVEVVPPAASGLPRLSATSSTFDLGLPLQIRYAANVMRTDLAGTVVRRMNAPIAGARLTVVGSLGAVGMVTAGTSTVATGDVRIAGTADATGTLPTMLVPLAPLEVVIEVAPGDLAVTMLPAIAGHLDAPPLRLITTAALDARGIGLPGATLELVPTGALEMASAPTLRLTAAAGGAIAATLPAGGHYALRFHDPLGRGAPLILPDREITAIAASHKLPKALRLQGLLHLLGTALPNASVQILCDTCSGVDRAKPLVEVVSDAAGRFTLAVQDPGTR